MVDLLSGHDSMSSKKHSDQSFHCEFAIIFGGFPIPSISPQKNKLESPSQHLETSEGQPFEAIKSTLQDDIQDLHHGGKSCQQRD